MIHIPTTQPTQNFIPFFIPPSTVRPAKFGVALLFPPGTPVAAGINVMPLNTNVDWKSLVVVDERGGPVVGTIERVLDCVGRTNVIVVMRVRFREGEGTRIGEVVDVVGRRVGDGVVVVVFRIGEGGRDAVVAGRGGGGGSVTFPCIGGRLVIELDVLCVDADGFDGTVSIWKRVVDGLVKKWVVNVGFTAVEVRRMVVSELVKVWIVMEGRVKKGIDEVVDVLLDGTSEVRIVLDNGGVLVGIETGEGVGGIMTGTKEVEVDELELIAGVFVGGTG
ncbi:hypothetical protein GLAREA_12345 [Glarea lozoyensis ATCC 20868]|uniref:Uncharacterized protein n=1 Tax=Glarea lozoyensis (strain ATCC 20868 / MF5171) TaxID=1116229 RepID=S3D344_GLAL2|nr:uncharacterized protein GLAREA_12345 [Glarea lozoyensis ATCC 20868]EPE31589.1 hypothetical protein GLAREA_12345 [Glarea lozoyensis ATCC 20868]